MTGFAAWQEENRRYVALAIDALHGDDDDVREAAAELAAAMTPPPALARLAETFGLDPFEADVLLRCVAAEIDPRFRGGGGDDDDPATVAGLLDRLPDGHWSAFDANAPLRRWSLVELDLRAPFADAPVRIDPDVLAYVLGMSMRSPLANVVQPVTRSATPLPAHVADAERLAQAVALTTSVRGRVPAVELHGASGEERSVIAALTTERLGGTLHEADARDLSAVGAELAALLRRWDRYARLAGAHLLVHAGAREDDDTGAGLRRTLAAVAGPVLVSVARPTTDEPSRPLLRHEVRALTTEDRLELWWAALAPCLERLGLEPDRALEHELLELAVHFRLGSRAIGAICLEAEALAAPPDGEPADARALAAALRAGCRRAVRARLDPVAERVPLSGGERVELPERERAALDEVVAQIRLTHRVNERGGFDRGARREVVALFAGPSGTGKTHAALAIAREVGLDLYRVNVSEVLSKWIGETEQNLERLFDATAIGGAILLFDEADALFGKRGDVRDSHDRYANLSTAYLLQRIERAPAPTILTTNLRSALDPAFTRRLSVIVEFPFPSEEIRERIWQAVFPPGVATRDLEPARLARLAVPGATIENVALRAAYFAAARGEDAPVEMADLRESAVRDARQSGRELTAEEVEGW